MKIPKHFRLMGHSYSVRIIKKSEWKDPEAVGLFDNMAREILILKADIATIIPQEESTGDTPIDHHSV